MFDLAGDWTLRDAQGHHQASLRLPGDGVSALHAAGLIPDPYWGRNEYECRWVGETDWIATREVDLADPAVILVIDGLDCVAEVSVNGKQVLAADNVYLTHRVDLTGVAVAGRNRIQIRFRSAVTEAARRAAAQPWPVPHHADNNPIPHGNMLRKVPCDFGWDWNIALANFGVTGGIHLEPRRDHRISGVLVDQQHDRRGVTVSVGILLEARHAEPFDWEVTLCGKRIGGSSVFADRHDRIDCVLPLGKQPLWWPAGQGDQVLHDLTIRVDDQTVTRRIGLRDMALVVEPDASGTSFKFRVNGRDVFAKGANWIPADALPSRITPQATRDLLQSAVDANMNMIRVWGGGRYEPDWFYDLCDEMGLMVWQDFMFACMMYPSDDGFLDGVAAEVRETVTRIGHHACIATWCGDNELIGALNWFPETRANRDRYLVGYDRLNRTIETALKQVLPTANWWPSSPSPGYMNFGDAWHDDSAGDMHFWSVWHEGRDFDHYRDVSPRFCSEFGFQSYPSMEVIKTFAGPQDWNIAAPVFESHQKNAGGNARIAETMFRYFRFPVDFPNFVYLSQVQQGLAIKTAVTHWRSLRPHCMGALIWQLNDTWPVCSWSSLDYGGNWKLLHHMARDFFAPVLVTAVPLNDGISVRVVSDLPETVEVTVDLAAITAAGGSRDLGRKTLRVAGSAKQALRLKPGTLAADEMLSMVWHSAAGEGRDVWAPKPYKSYDLQAPEITMKTVKTEAGWQITLAAGQPAFFVALEASLPGRFTDNAFTLLPGQPVTVGFAKTGPGTPDFTIRDLHGATYGGT